MSGAELCERQFQSTPPARGRLEKILLRLKKTAISIHAPREGGGDCRASTQAPVPTIFQSTPPRGGATMVVRRLTPMECISIHAPARGGDLQVWQERLTLAEFQSTPPRGGGDVCMRNPIGPREISIHAPARGGDQTVEGEKRFLLISIHAPARGGDSTGLPDGQRSAYFNPRPREGGRP